MVHSFISLSIPCIYLPWIVHRTRKFALFVILLAFTRHLLSFSASLAHDPALSDSIECRAFRTCFQKLVGGISNPSLLAVSLYSKGIISSVTRDEVTSTSLLLTDRVLKLVAAVERQIESSPDAFVSFVDALRENRSRVYLADFLISAYRK